MDYDELRRSWDWQQVRAEISGGRHPARFNMAYIAVDRHAAAGRDNALAFVTHSLSGRREVTYGELSALTNRVANVLGDLGLQPGDRVFTLLGRQLEIYLTALGTLKAGAVFCPLFSSFGPEPVRARLELGSARVLVTSRLLYQRKVDSIRHLLPALEHVIVVDGQTDSPLQDTLDFESLTAAASDAFEIGATDPQAPALLHFTSGTTGTPKGALHVHDAVVSHYATARLALDLQAGDRYWRDAGHVPPRGRRRTARTVVCRRHRQAIRERAAGHGGWAADRVAS